LGLPLFFEFKRRVNFMLLTGYPFPLTADKQFGQPDFNGGGGGGAAVAIKASFHDTPLE